MKSKADVFDLQQSQKLHSLCASVCYDEHEPKEIKKASECVEDILDAVYEKADINKIAEECANLADAQKNDLCLLLKKYEALFDSALGDWDTTPVSLELEQSPS